MEIIVVRTSVTTVALITMAEQQFGDMVKAVVDIDRGIMAIGGELHSDEEALLLEQGSLQKNLWGINRVLTSIRNVRPRNGLNSIR